MFKPIAAAVTAIVIAAAPLVAAAQTTAVKLDLAKRYIQVAKLDKQLAAVTDTMGPVSAKSLIRELEIRPGSTDARHIERLMEEVGDATEQVMRPRFLEQMAEAYAAAYTEEELQGLVTFYSSPIGQSITAKSPSLAPAPSEAMLAFMGEVDVEFERQLCKRIGCENTGDIKL